MFGHNDLAAGMAGLARLQRRRPIPCDALDGAGRGPDGMWMGKDPGADERFGARRSFMAWAGTTTPTSSR
jgi:hypothetical protein